MSRLFIILIIFGLLGCTKQIQKEYIKPNLKVHIVERPTPLVLKPVKFKVITTPETNLLLSFKDYENLSLNMADIIEYIKNQNNIILYYENILKEN